MLLQACVFLTTFSVSRQALAFSGLTGRNCLDVYRDVIFDVCNVAAHYDLLLSAVKVRIIYFQQSLFHLGEDRDCCRFTLHT